jgi:hypothetical protein
MSSTEAKQRSSPRKTVVKEALKCLGSVAQVEGHEGELE